MKHVPILIVLALAAACGAVQVQPVKVDPIHVTVDVNVHDASAPKR
jgi:hypothetical protein